MRPMPNRYIAFISIAAAFTSMRMAIRTTSSHWASLPDSKPDLSTMVYVDAYPDMTLAARFVAASPVAASAGLGGGVKTFTAVFQLEGSDPRLMPDLSAAIVFDAHEGTAAPAERAALVGVAK